VDAMVVHLEIRRRSFLDEAKGGESFYDALELHGSIALLLRIGSSNRQKPRNSGNGEGVIRLH